jgi:hypothetical protein
MRSGSTLSTAPPAAKLDAFENADATIDALFDASNFGYNYAMFVVDPDVEAKEPKNFQNDWNHLDEGQRAKWHEAINHQQRIFLNLKKRKVWMKIKHKDIHGGRQLVKDCWVWNIKRNEFFCAHLVACGYSQVPGLDYDKNFAPMINDVAYRIMLILKILWDLKGIIIEVKGAFLHRDLEGQAIYMDAPEGLDAALDECVLLGKTIYSLVQIACQFYKKVVLIKILKILRFKGGYLDPCFMA